MGIHKNLRDGCIDCWCDGCGARVQVPSLDWWAGKRAVDAMDWYTIATDYGCLDGPAWEHFCSAACLDPIEWQ